MKSKFRYIFILFGILTLSINVCAQNQIIDSLKLALKNARHDTTRCNILNELVEVEGDDNIWTLYNEQLLKLSEKNISTGSKFRKFYLRHYAASLNSAGYFAKQHGDIQKALEYYQKSLKICREINDKEGIATNLSNIGIVYDNQGDIPKTLDYYHMSLKLSEEIGDKQGIAISLNNIASVYKDQGDFTTSLEYHFKSLKINKEIDNKEGIALSLCNIAVIYRDQGEIIKALEFQNNSLKISEQIGYIVGIGRSLNNLGAIYNDQDDRKKALEYYKKSLNIREKSGEKKELTRCLNNIASILMMDRQLSEALDYGNRSLQKAKELGYPNDIYFAAQTLKKIYIKQNKHQNALAMYELEIQMRDSINNKETKKASVKKQFQYQYEKQAAADSVKHGEEQKVKNALLTAQQAQLKQEKIKSYALYGGLALVLVFAGFMVNRIRVTYKQKQIIELKEVETQKQNVVITQQKHLVEEKHKEITDSINYAERIQRSFLATKDQLDSNLKDYFVLFQPKDVVSGDFYWAHTLKNGNFALVTADSTGHGVPGAIMSLLNTSSLEKAVELGIYKPAEILNHTRATIIERLKKDGSVDGGKDGMDCSLISLNKDKSKLVYAAANNPVWIIRKRHCEGNSLNQSQTSDEIDSLPRNDENNELIELKSDKIPVGKHDRDTVSFTQHEVELQKGDMIYTLTDGFPDQFGGPKGKKFMYKKLKEMLVSISKLPINEQHKFLENSLNKWMGNTEQVDDITIIGIRV